MNNNLNLNLLLDDDELSAMQKVFVRKLIKYELYLIRIDEINGNSSQVVEIKCSIPGKRRAIQRTYNTKQTIDETYKYIMMDIIKLNSKYLEKDEDIQKVKVILANGYKKKHYNQTIIFKNEDRFNTQFATHMKSQSLFKVFEIIVQNVNLTLRKN